MTKSPDSGGFLTDVFPAELDEIRRRKARSELECQIPPDAAETGPKASHGLVGLAFSGGGIRSASFSLGVAQFLIGKGLFKHVDYLSTVSGGGYIGSSISSLMAKEPGGTRHLVAREGAEEPPALNHIRNNSNFLVPRGFLNRVRMPSLYMIGVVQVLMLFLPIVVLCIFLTDLFFEAKGWLPVPIAGPMLALVGVTPFVIMIFWRPILQTKRRTWEARDRSDRRAGACLALALTSILAIPVLQSIEFLTRNDIDTVIGSCANWIRNDFAQGWGSWLLWVSLILIGAWSVAKWRRSAFPTFVLIGAMGPVFLISVYLLGCVLVIDSPHLDPSISREFHQRLEQFVQTGDHEPLDNVVSRVLSNKHFDASVYEIDYRSINRENFNSTSLKIHRDPEASASWWHRNPRLAWMTRRQADELTLNFHPFDEQRAYFDELSIINLNAEWYIYLGALAVWLFNYLFANINRMSLHPFYRDRLSRTFLIRKADAGIISADSLLLSEMAGEGSDAPYHLVNTALNLQGSNNPQLRQRKTVPFLFSKRYCGSEYTGYCETTKVEELDVSMNLGTAMAISAAAAGPMMGAKTKRSLAFFLALLNVRLAYWLPHPSRARKAAWFEWLFHRNPGLRYLLAEALGTVNDRGRFVNCSDGGHIENLGVYELIKRRCRTIICVDGGADPEFNFFDLTTLQRFVNIDLDARIDIEVAPIMPTDEQISKEHFAVGTITYHDGQKGTLFYLKLSYSGDEPEYVKFYKRSVPAFPHEPTSDQFFTETKFEVYRALGNHVARQAFKQPAIRKLLTQPERVAEAVVETSLCVPRAKQGLGNRPELD